MTAGQKGPPPLAFSPPCGKNTHRWFIMSQAQAPSLMFGKTCEQGFDNVESL